MGTDGSEAAPTTRERAPRGCSRRQALLAFLTERGLRDGILDPRAGGNPGRHADAEPLATRGGRGEQPARLHNVVRVPDTAQPGPEVQVRRRILRAQAPGAVHAHAAL